MAVTTGQREDLVRNVFGQLPPRYRANASWMSSIDVMNEVRAFDTTGTGEELELYFGATSGELFGSGDAGATWSTVASRLPPVYSVTAVSR